MMLFAPRQPEIRTRRQLEREGLPVSKTHMDLHDRGFGGASGANEIISLLRYSPMTKYLILGHNPLGDEGIVVLFRYLCAPAVRQALPITEISLNSCQIGNLGLEAIARYLRGNTSLQSLFLQNNSFRPAWSIVSAFTTALNESCLVSLSLNCNPQLSDDFLFRFLPNLDAPNLRSLQLSDIGLTLLSTPHLLTALTEQIPEDQDAVLRPRLRIRDLRLNGNRFTSDCALQLITVLKNRNFSLQHLEMFSNRFRSDPSPNASTVSLPSSGQQTPGEWKDFLPTLSPIFARNLLLTRYVTSSALKLLTPARTLLLLPPAPRESIAPWRQLPLEIQTYILSLLSVFLSSRQRSRIWAFASDRETLPTVASLFTLPSLFRRATIAQTKEEQRETWLARVGCEGFEWHEGWEEEMETI